MLRNYFKTAVRNLTKGKLFSFINITGLAVGLGAFLLIFQFVSFEQSFDNFHNDVDRLYRVQFERVYTDKHDKSAGLTAGAGPALEEDFPEVEAFSKLWSAGFMSNLFTVGEEVFNEKKLFYADESFFRLFSFDLVAGSVDQVLKEANSLVLSETKAISYFGSTNVIGKTIRVNNAYDDQVYQVSGVFKDLPRNTHFDFDLLLSFKSLENATDGDAATSFGWNAFPTYLKLAAGTDHKVLEAKFPEWTKGRYAELIADGVEPRLYLQPLESIYLESKLRFEVGPTGNARIVQILTGVALFILILAYFNYINLSTSKSLERTKEIGVRKVNGASRTSLIKQFLIESFIVNLIGIVLGFTLMQVSIPFFEQTLDRPLSEMIVINQSFIVLILVLLTAGTLLSGFYPAWILSRFKTIRVLKGQRAGAGSDGMVRKGLVILQFAILCFLLVGSLAVRSQIDYMLNSDWGFDSDQVVVVSGPSLGQGEGDRLTTFKNELRLQSHISQVSNTTMIPGNEIKWVNNGVRLTTSPENEITSIPFLGIDDTYVGNLSLEVLAGRTFNKDLANEWESLLLSRAAAEQFGFPDPEDALNKKITDGGQEYNVIGVVENFLQKSFKSGYDPIMYRYVPNANNYLCVRVAGGDYEAALKDIESQYTSHFPGSTFTYFFLDEYFERQFTEDRIFGKVFNFFTLLGIWISILGLFGLTSYAVLQRRKEIGIRKVLGASIGSVVLLISKRFIYLTLIAIALAIPIAFYATNSWLDSYSFATGIRAYVFVVPVVVLLAITLLTTGLLSLKSATDNPVDSLRYE
ncbi:MAG: ABC transporter permease [Roseivirga sp.]